MKQPKETKYIVMYDDNDSLNIPMTFESECEGALQASFSGQDIALFDDSKSARRAIAISVACNKLRKVQGLPVNEDFLPPYLKFVSIRKCVSNTPGRSA